MGEKPTKDQERARRVRLNPDKVMPWTKRGDASAAQEEVAAAGTGQRPGRGTVASRASGEVISLARPASGRKKAEREAAARGHGGRKPEGYSRSGSRLTSLDGGKVAKGKAKSKAAQGSKATYRAKGKKARSGRGAKGKVAAFTALGRAVKAALSPVGRAAKAVGSLLGRGLGRAGAALGKAGRALSERMLEGAERVFGSPAEAPERVLPRRERREAERRGLDVRELAKEAAGLGREAAASPREKLLELNWPFLVSFFGLGALLLFPPYFRGLFFPKEQEWALLGAAVVALGCLWWLVRRRDYDFLSHPMDYLALAVPVTYIASAFAGPASPRLAVDGVIKVVLYFLVFWTASRLAITQPRRLAFFNFAYLAVVGVAAAGFLTAVGVVHIKDGFVNGRIFSTMQYPNSLAAYLAAGSFLGFYLWGRTRERWRWVYALGNYLLLLVFVSTLSRGAFLVYPAAALIFLIFVPGEKRWWWVSHVILVGAAALLGNWRLLAFIQAGKMGWAWGWLGLGAGAALVGELLLLAAQRILSGRLKMAPGRAGGVVAAILVVVLIVGAVGFALTRPAQPVPAAGPGAPSGQAGGQAAPGQTTSGGTAASPQPAGAKGILERFLPPQLAQRLESINIGERNASERLYWAGEAINMIKERPWLGWGGGGWEAAYRARQSYLYSSTQVHNDWIQLGVETGALGEAAWLGLWIAFLIVSLQNWRRYRREAKVAGVASATSPAGTAGMASRPGPSGATGAAGASEGQFQQTALTVAALMIGGHALIDFDLSLGAISILLWWCWGMTRGAARAGRRTDSQLEAKRRQQPGYSWLGQYWPQLVPVALVVAIAVVLPVMFLGGQSAAAQGEKALQSNQVATAQQELSRATKYNPFDPLYRLQLAQVMIMSGDAAAADAQLARAEALGRYDWGIHAAIAQLEWMSDKREQAVKNLEAARDNWRWSTQPWEDLSEAYLVSGLSLTMDAQNAENPPKEEQKPAPSPSDKTTKPNAEVKPAPEAKPDAQLAKSLREQAKGYFEKAQGVPAAIEKQMASLSPRARQLWETGTQPLLAPTLRMRANAAVAGYYLTGDAIKADQELAALQKQAEQAKDAFSQSQILVWRAVLKEQAGDSKAATGLLDQAEKLAPGSKQQFDQIKTIKPLKPLPAKP